VNTPPESTSQNSPKRLIDWSDWKIAVLVGISTAAIKLLAHARPDWRINGMDVIVANVLLVGYIVARARRTPEKLDEWGLTTPLSPAALISGLLLLLTGVVVIAGVASTYATLEFRPDYVPKMVNYLLGAFPQQFFMCSVGLVTLAKFPVFQGAWRLPLFVGLVFGLAHWWTPATIPGTFIPIQMVCTIPVGFICAFYFLKFRNILPLTLMHAILYVLWASWVESNL